MGEGGGAGEGGGGRKGVTGVIVVRMCEPVFRNLLHSYTWPLIKPSRKRTYIILTPLNPHLYSKTGVYRGIYHFLLISALNIDCGYSLEPPRRGGSNGYPHSMFRAEIRKIPEFLSENFQFLVVKFSIYLNRRVFVMRTHSYT